MDDVKKQLSGLVFDFRPSLLEAVPPTSDFMACVKSLISELSKYNSSFESISESVQNAEDFSADVSSVLRELECPYDGIYSGPYEERFVETKDKVCLLTYLASEIQAEQICAKKKTEQSGNGVLDHAGKEGYQQMKALIRALKMQKPPKTITSQQLFSGIDKKIDSFLNGRLLPDVIGKVRFFCRTRSFKSLISGNDHSQAEPDAFHSTEATQHFADERVWQQAGNASHPIKSYSSVIYLGW